MKPNGKLDRKTREEIERVLREKHAQLEEAMRKSMSRWRTTDTGRPADSAIWATAALDDEIQVALMDRHNRHLAQIEAALEQLRRGQYGICRDCEKPIGPARLRALPFAQRCGDCQSRAEGHAPSATGPVGAAVGVVQPIRTSDPELLPGQLGGTGEEGGPDT